MGAECISASLRQSPYTLKNQSIKDSKKMDEIKIFNQRVNFKKIQTWLIKPGLSKILACLSILLTLPALGVGFVTDDLIHRAIFLGSDLHPPIDDISFFGLFAFINGDPERIKDIMDVGMMPWWTLEDLRVNFFRPLSEITHWIDYLLWPNTPSLMHAQSLLWFGCLIWAVTKLYRRIMGLTWIAGLAALLYAIDDAHGLPASWIANRNALLATFFGVLCLLAHDRWRKDGWKPGMFFGPCCLLLGLLSGESALAACFYLFSYSLFIESGAFHKKMLSLVPYVAVAGTWLLVYKHHGFGAYGSGMYIDPVQEPVTYSFAFIQRAPILLMEQFGAPPAFFYGMLPDIGNKIMLAWAVFFLLTVCMVIVPLLRRNTTACFWMLGMMLSLIPIASTNPMGRLLFFVGLGGMGLLAQFISGFLENADWLPSKKSWNTLGLILLNFFIGTHILFAPLLLPLNTIFHKSFHATINEPARNNLLNSDVPEQQVVLINPPGFFSVYHTMLIRITEGLATPSYTRLLVTGNVPVEITRTDKWTLEIQPEEGYFKSFLDKGVRGLATPMELGQKIELTGMSVEILSLTEDNRPKRVKFRFSDSLEAATTKFLVWREGNYHLYKPPDVGLSDHLKGEKKLFNWGG